MKKQLLALLLVVFTMSLSAQTRRKATNSRQTTTKKVTTNNKKRTTTPKRPAGKKTTTKGKAPSYSTPAIKGLQAERNQIQQKIRQQEQALRANQADVKKRLQDLLVLNTQIDERQKNIEGIQKDIHGIDNNIGILTVQLQNLQSQLDQHKEKYIKSLQYSAKHHNVQENMMFIFSAESLTQLYRRMRFVKEYAAYQKAQGDIIKMKQQQIGEKNQQLKVVKGQKNTLLYKGQQEKKALEGQQGEQKKVVASLQQQQKTIQSVIAEQRQKDAELNKKIDALIAEEVAKARARAAAEAKRRAEAAAEAKRKAEELARKKAAAEAAARENARRIAEAKAREERLKAEARAAERAADAAKRKEAEQLAREAEAARVATERKAQAEEERNQRDISNARKSVEDAQRMNSVDRMMSGGFEANKGRLPMPITGSYRIVSHFGQYNVEGLKNVTLDNKGINILGSSGCQARAIYDGEVSAVFGFSGSMVVMVRHGAYISVYCNLRSVNVSKGQKVSTRQTLGAVGADNILQFQLRRETAKLNPEAWLGH
ncbi:murein hydrolase activator EnvC family protein [Hoylesella nanceiensis]|jgi:peptidase, M23/M37 family|uniref:murein hydrolase activator EnvC family protein n=1 Tax=Hoylesella nanceiensis TaxID=425941 RepID=UPI001CB111D1|nr:peptidoglycan DD-metalloendopeptidase family protein [Hoylesella nanceiensis]MBF1426719.1 peptidoglycan DD-metalloendopeptidase family protein [Hoylesella nanceiensis]